MPDLFTWAATHRHATCTPPADPLPTAQVPAEFRSIWQILLAHRGASTAITAPSIAAAAGLWPDATPANRGTRVRKVLELAQDAWPEPVIGDAAGYYLAASPDELTHYCANLRSRALAIFRRYASTRRAGRRAGYSYLGRGRWSPGTH